MEFPTKFGLWTALRFGEKRGYIYCKCDCGTERSVPSFDLKAGKSKGCGCTRQKKMCDAARLVKITHGLTLAREYRIWIDMKRRCLQPQRPDYHRYGGRGISVCDRWKESFDAFYADMGPSPPKYTLERRDNNGDYGPDNCYWASIKEQHQNTRTNRYVVINGERMTIAAAADKHKTDRSAVYRRIKRGWDPAAAVLTPWRKRPICR